MNVDHAPDADDILYPSIVPFILLHVACCAVLWTGVTWRSAMIGFALYWLRMFAVGAGYHRYFSHRAYATSRAFQFILAFLAQTTAQKSILWWAAKHRHHHLHADTARDVHSPKQNGFFYAHVGWIFVRAHDKADLSQVKDLTRYAELLWLHKFELAPALALAAFSYLIGGWPGLIVGFCWSTVATYHATFCINSLAQVHGKKRYVTGDESRNNWLLALLTMGEGWHNNHHAYQASARQGFRRWEIDATFYLLKALAWVGVVWDLKAPSVALLRNEQRLGSKVIERAAANVADSFDIEAIVFSVRSAIGNATTSADLHMRKFGLIPWTAERLVSLPLSNVPTLDDVLARAAGVLARSCSLNDISERAHDMILSRVVQRLS